MTLSGYILNYVVTPASVHDIRADDDLLENYHQPYIWADLGYLSYELREHLDIERLPSLDTFTSKDG